MRPRQEDPTMTDRQILERMIFLTNKLCDVCNKDGYGSDAYYAVLNEVHELGAEFKCIRQVSRGVMNFVIIAAILFVLYLVYCIVSEGFV